MPVQKGFTLLELVITLAIAAIVVGLAAPSFSNMIQDNRLSSQTLDFVAALNLARSEAIKRRTRVTLCKSRNEADCSSNNNDWGQGWIVFVDNNANNQRDGGETILRVHGPLSGNNTLTGNRNFSNFIAYSPSGSSTQFGTMSLCDPRRDNSKGKAIRINRTGRVMVSTIEEAISDGRNPRTCT